MFNREHAYFATGDAVFEDRIPVLVLLPKSQENWVYDSFFGLLEYITLLPSWITGGETTTDEAVDIFKQVYDEARAMLFLIGMISDFAAPLPDDSGWLQCDGALYLQTDYPDLYAAIGDTYHSGTTPTGYFRVPDTRGRVRATINSGLSILPSWADAAGGSGGASTITLSTAEMPSHTHTDAGHTHAESGAIASVTSISPGAPQPTALATPAVTSAGFASLSSEGGDGAHDNVQPTIALYTYILAKF